MILIKYKKTSLNTQTLQTSRKLHRIQKQKAFVFTEGYQRKWSVDKEKPEQKNDTSNEEQKSLAVRQADCVGK